MDRYEYQPVPVEQLADYLNTSEGHEFTFHPPTLVRNAIRELYDIKTRKPSVADNLLLLGYMFVTESGCVTYSISDLPIAGWTLVGPIYGPVPPRVVTPS